MKNKDFGLWALLSYGLFCVIVLTIGTESKFMLILATAVAMAFLTLLLDSKIE